MTRQECEAKLLSLAEQMRAVYMEYNPAGDHLGAIMSRDGYIGVHDTMFQTVDVKKYSDGHIRYGSPAKEGAE